MKQKLFNRTIMFMMIMQISSMSMASLSQIATSPAAAQAAQQAITAIGAMSPEMLAKFGYGKPEKRTPTARQAVQQSYNVADGIVAGQLRRGSFASSRSPLNQQVRHYYRSPDNEENPYKVIGVRPGASEAEINQARREALKKVHPDSNPNDPKASAKSARINDAYDRIKEDRKSGYTKNSADQNDAPQSRQSTHKPQGHQQGWNSSYEDHAKHRTQYEQPHTRTRRSETNHHEKHEEHTSGPGYTGYSKQEARYSSSSWSSRSSSSEPFGSKSTDDLFDKNGNPSWEKLFDAEIKGFGKNSESMFGRSGFGKSGFGNDYDEAIRNMDATINAAFGKNRSGFGNSSFGSRNSQDPSSREVSPAKKKDEGGIISSILGSWFSNK